MAQAGYTPISLYYSTTSTQEPTAGNLVNGELAINIADGKLFYKNSAGNVRLLSIGYGSSSVTPTNGGVQYGTGTALALTAAGSSGQILRSNGTAAPTWADLSTLGVNTISFGTTGLTPNSATAGAVTVAGTLVTANGGTGLGGATPFTANGVLYASSASALTSGSALTFDGTNFASPRIQLGGATATGINNGEIGLTNSAAIRWRNNANSAYINAIYLDNTDSLQLGGGGAVANQIFGIVGVGEAMRLTSTGLGIGTSSPAYKLDVRSGECTANLASTTGTNFVYQKFSNTGGDLYAGIERSTGGFLGPTGAYEAFFVYGGTGGMALGGNGYVRFLTNNTEKMRLDTSGNLGLGVTPSAWETTTFRASQIGTGIGSGSLVGRIDGSNGVGLVLNGYYTATGWKYIASSYATYYSQSNGQHIWNTAPSGTAGNAITFTQAMTLDASGNLTVGYTATVNNEKIGAAGAILSTAATLSTFNANNAGFDFNASTKEGRFFSTSTNTTGGFMTFTTGQNGSYSERARITSGGNFLVGTQTSGDGLLEVSTGAATTAQLINTASGNYNIKCWNQATSGDNSFVLFITEGGGGTARGSITYNRAGGLVAYNTTSDYRAKDIIGPVTNSGEVIDSLTVYEGKMKGATQSRPMLIAHEAQAHAPYAVTGKKDAFNEDGTPKFQQIDVSSLVPLLLAEIQSLRQRVALLEGN